MLFRSKMTYFAESPYSDFLACEAFRSLSLIHISSFRILEEPLMVVGIGVAFAKDDDRGICEQMEQTLEEMRQDGTSMKTIEKYLDDPEKYLEVDDLGY